MTPPPGTDTRSAYPSLLVVILGIVLVAASLRGPIVAITPVLGQVSADLALGAGAAGLLGTLPVLAFAVCSPLAALVIRRLGPESAVLLTLAGILVSQLVRAVPTTATLFAGTIALGVAITVGNIVVPVLIHRDVSPPRVAMVTGIYTAVLNIGSLLTVLSTAPLAEALGWPRALALWSVPAAVALAVSAVVQHRLAAAASRRDAAGEAAARHTEGTVPSPASRRATTIRATWLLSAAFAAQAFAYYGYTTWLPTYLADSTAVAATVAGALAASFQAFGIVGGIVIPIMIRALDLRRTALAVGMMWLTFSTGALTAPGLIAVWLIVGGVAQAGGLIVIFTAVAMAARDPREAAGMSAFVQALGYVVAALAGPVIGVLRDASSGWPVPMAAMVAVTALCTALMITAAVHVDDEARRASPEWAG